MEILTINISSLFSSFNISDFCPLIINVSIPSFCAQCNAPITLEELPEHDKPITKLSLGLSTLVIVYNHLVKTSEKP